MVSQASQHVGFALRPAHEAAVFDRVEFVPLGAARVLVVIVARGGQVMQKVIELERDRSTPTSCAQAANYLNAEFSGLPLHRAREAVLERMNEERSLYDALLSRAHAAGDLDLRPICRTTGRCTSTAPPRCSTMRPG